MFAVKAVRNFVSAKRNEIFRKIAKEIREMITVSQTKKTSRSFGKLPVVHLAQRFRANGDIRMYLVPFAFSLKLGKGSSYVNKQQVEFADGNNERGKKACSHVLADSTSSC